MKSTAIVNNILNTKSIASPGLDLEIRPGIGIVLVLVQDPILDRGTDLVLVPDPNPDPDHDP